MTDREMLEFAAKAAGIDVSAGWSVRLNAFYVEPEQETGAYAGWNPLTDDGDALRLAVKLYLWEPIRLAHRDVTVGVDIYAATRRAIVRAAAEIGRRMP